MVQCSSKRRLLFVAVAIVYLWATLEKDLLSSVLGPISSTDTAGPADAANFNGTTANLNIGGSSASTAPAMDRIPISNSSDGSATTDEGNETAIQSKDENTAHFINQRLQYEQLLQKHRRGCIVVVDDALMSPTRGVQLMVNRSVAGIERNHKLAEQLYTMPYWMENIRMGNLNGSREAMKNAIEIPTCPIDNGRKRWSAITFSAHKIDIQQQQQTVCNSSNTIPLAFISHLQRPHHATHFVWSLVSIIAAQEEAHIDYQNVPSFVAIRTYASVKTLEQFSTHPHSGLLKLLSGRSIDVFSEQALGGEFVHLQNVSTALSGPLQGLKTTEITTQPKSAGDKCILRAVYGALPLHIPSKKSALMPNHTQALRQRAIDIFGLKTDANPNKVLVIHRKRDGRRKILNHDDLVSKLKSSGLDVAEVDWQGMDLKSMLQIAINARAIVGAHGNGLVWACMMKQGGVVVEISSRWRGLEIKYERPANQMTLKRMNDGRLVVNDAKPVVSFKTHGQRNEVEEGEGKRSPSNVAATFGLRSLSLLVNYSHTNYSWSTSPTRMWKYVDMTLSSDEMEDIVSFVKKGKWNQARRRAYNHALNMAEIARVDERDRKYKIGKYKPR